MRWEPKIAIAEDSDMATVVPNRTWPNAGPTSRQFGQIIKVSAIGMKAMQPLRDLGVEQSRRTVQQIDLDEPVHQPFHDVIAPFAHGLQIVELVIQHQCL